MNDGTQKGNTLKKYKKIRRENVAVQKKSDAEEILAGHSVVSGKSMRM